MRGGGTYSKEDGCRAHAAQAAQLTLVLLASKEWLVKSASSVAGYAPVQGPGSVAKHVAMCTLQGCWPHILGERRQAANPADQVQESQSGLLICLGDCSREVSKLRVRKACCLSPIPRSDAFVAEKYQRACEKECCL